MSDKVAVSVPGKIHLMGEHAVVWGRPALLSAISWRLYVTVSQNKGGLQIISQEPITLINKAVEIVQKRFKLSQKPHVKIKINSQIPVGRHTGSSAAVSVGVIAALVFYLKKIWNPNLVNELAFEVEKYQHRNPSGGDNTAVTFGGFIWFRRELEFLKSIWQLAFRPSPKLAPFMLIDTGRPEENTGEMITSVTEFIKKYPGKAKKLLDENEEATKDVTMALREGNEKLLINAIGQGEKTLEGLGVVSKKVIPLIREIEKKGGAAKILGGGGKKNSVGLLLCYSRNKQSIKKITEKYFYKIYSVKLGEEGVRLESGKK